MTPAWAPDGQPFGLNRLHQSSRQRGKGAGSLHRVTSQLQRFTLSHMPKSNIGGPILMIPRINSAPPSYCPLRTRVQSPHDLRHNKMSFVSSVRRINLGPATGKERRGRKLRSKTALQPSVAYVARPTAATRKRLRRGLKPAELANRPGASRNAPITIESDEEEPEHAGPIRRRRYALLRTDCHTNRC